MSYPALSEKPYEEFLQDLLSRKEFAMLKLDDTSAPEKATDRLEMRSYQRFITSFMNVNTTWMRLHLYHMAGAGKCHGKGTRILMFDGTIKLVEHIIVGDQLMGDDSTPRVVLSLARGCEQMCVITPQHGKSFTCNRSHILSVQRHGAIYDVPIDELLQDDQLYRNPIQLYSSIVVRAAYLHDFILRYGHINVTERAVILQALSNISDMIYLCESLALQVEYYFAKRAFKIYGDFSVFACACDFCQKLSVIRGSTSVPFAVKHLDVGEYYGFELSGNHRYVLGNFIVTHNTLAAVAVGHNFTFAYKKLYEAASVKLPPIRRNYAELNAITPNIYVLGFAGTRKAFRRELLKYSEFGFITQVELEKRARLQQAAASGMPTDVQALKDFVGVIKKRIQNKKRGGFYKFLGYDELALHLFKSDTLKLTELEKQVRADTTLEAVINEKIASGELSINTTLLKSFEHSLMICDEVHQTYNMQMKNNRGVALQYILDAVPSVRFLSLSATPMNSSPTEIVEILNYLLPHKVQKQELFVGQSLLANSLEQIGKLSQGYFSFLRDIDPEYYPKRILSGVELRLPHTIAGVGDVLPYLRFIECPMSELHQQTLMHYLQTAEDDAVDTEAETEIEQTPQLYKSTIPTDGYAIMDLVYPSGLFRSKNFFSLIAAQDHALIKVKKYAGIQTVTGRFLHRDNIGTYSTKLLSLLNLLQNIIASCGGDATKTQKTLIYHDRVTMSGAMLLSELLRENNFLDEATGPLSTTMCMVCGAAMSEHDETTHVFIPARFAVVHSYMDKSKMDALLDKFNDVTNARGHNFFVLIGTKIISESYDFKDVQRMIMLSMPVNFSTLIQVYGRCVRNGSHRNLPKEHWVVQIHTLITTINPDYPHPNLDLSPEMQRYINKVSSYVTIQQIEQEISKNAIDAYANRNIIMRNAEQGLGSLNFEPLTKYDLQKVNLLTFNANRGYVDEVSELTYLIKYLYTQSPVWTYDDLWIAVRDPPVKLYINAKMFTENNFIIALNNLTSPSQHSPKSTVTATEWLFNTDFRYIYTESQYHKIVQYDKYYIRFPIGQSINRDIVIADVETYVRPYKLSNNVRVNLNAYVNDIKHIANYALRKEEFIAEFANAEHMTEMLFAYNGSFQRAILEEAIPHMIDLTATELEHRVIDLFTRFGVIIFKREVVKYTDVVKQFSEGSLDMVQVDMPIGYLSAKTCKMYDVNNGWFDINKVALNKQVHYKETGVVIGYIESTPYKSKFKLRKPAQVIRQESMHLTERSRAEAGTKSRRVVKIDSRFLENGIVCGTKDKAGLLSILAELGVSTKSLDKQYLKIKNLCNEIAKELLRLEMKERARDSRYKYFYGWWDERVELK